MNHLKSIFFNKWKKIVSATFLIAFFFLPHFSFSQTHINWNTLADVKFEQVYSDEYGITYDQATFGTWLLAMNGQEVKISGYMIPLDGMGLTWVLSRNPNATCFFCGGAGPETVIELRLKPSALKKYKLDEYRMFKGKLKLNPKNLESLTYILEDAEPI